MALYRSVLQKQQQSFCDVKKKVVTGLYAISWKTKQTSSFSSLQSHIQQQLKLIVSCMAISISQCCGGTSLQLVEVCGNFFLNADLLSSHQSISIRFSHCNMLSLSFFSHLVADLLLCFESLHDPVWSIIYYTEELMVSWSGSKTIPRLLMTKNKLNQDQYQLMHTGH